MRALAAHLPALLCVAALAVTALAQEARPPMQKPPGAAMEKRDAPSPSSHDVRRCLSSEFGLGSYDPISYHTGTPQRGDPAYFFDHDRVRYVFTDAANRDRFAAEPERYLARYGGWCAMSLALGSFTCPDYDNFQIEDGRLYLFETTVFTNGRTLWNQDPGSNRARADGYYRLRRAP